MELVREMYGARDFSLEQALRALKFHNYNIQQALMQMFEYPLPQQQAEDSWTREDLQLFDKAVKKFNKKFNKVAEEIGTHTVQSIIALYYSRKNVMRFLATTGRPAFGTVASERGMQGCCRLCVSCCQLCSFVQCFNMSLDRGPYVW